MTTIVRGIYRDGIIYPLEPVPLPDNTPVIIEIDLTPIEITEDGVSKKVYQITITPNYSAQA